jgi:hypothetical protein
MDRIAGGAVDGIGFSLVGAQQIPAAQTSA